MKAGPVATSIELAVLSAWLGAAILVAGSVAPAAFAVLPSRTMAGALVGRVLPVVFISGIVAAIVAVFCEMRFAKGAFQIKVTAPLIGLATGCAIAQFLIAPKIARIRDAVGGPIDALDPTDPRRVQFGSLHGFSVMWLGVSMLGAAVAIAFQFHSLRRGDSTVYSATGDRVS